MAATHRLRQGVRALLAFARPLDYTLPARYLTGPQLDLFRQMQRSEQQHGIDVLRDVLEQQPDTPEDLAVAALLHDLGKIRHPLPVWSKTLAVLIRAFLPARFQRWSQGNIANPFHRGCIVMVRHPAWGGELAAQVGVSATAVWLIAHHAQSLEQWRDHPHCALLERLQRADNAN